MRRPQPDNTPHLLAATLTQAGLHATTFTRDGRDFVHASPPHAPSAGTDVLCLPSPATGCRFVSEWGDQFATLHQAARHVLFLFGKTSPRH